MCQLTNCLDLLFNSKLRLEAPLAVKKEKMKKTIWLTLISEYIFIDWCNYVESESRTCIAKATREQDIFRIRIARTIFHSVFSEFYIKYTSSKPDLYRSTVHKEKSRNIFPKNWIPLVLHDLLVLFWYK